VNNEVLLSPPHNSNNNVQQPSNQRDNMLITQPSSIPNSPTLASPSVQSSTSFCLHSPSAMSINQNENEDITSDPNWQANKPTVRERNAAMFNNELMSDIQFIVGNEGKIQCINAMIMKEINFFFILENLQTIPAHKYVLATGSSVFFAMFYGGLAENKSEIRVPDVEPSAFLTMLRYYFHFF
jgi:BTB/POZ domain-containing protein 3/6